MNIDPSITSNNIFYQLLRREIGAQKSIDMNPIIEANLKVGRCARSILPVGQSHDVEDSHHLPREHNLWKVTAANDRILAIEPFVIPSYSLEHRIKIFNARTEQSLWSDNIPYSLRRVNRLLTDDYLVMSTDVSCDCQQIFAIRLEDGKIQWKKANCGIYDFSVIGEEIVVLPLTLKGTLEVWNLHNGEKIDAFHDISGYFPCGFLHLPHFGKYFVVATAFWVDIYDMEEKKLCYREVHLSGNLTKNHQHREPSIHIDVQAGKLAYLAFPKIKVVDLASQKIIYQDFLDSDVCVDGPSIVLHLPYLFFASDAGTLGVYNVETRKLKMIKFCPPAHIHVRVDSLSIKDRMLKVSYRNLSPNPQDATSFIDLSTLKLVANNPGKYFLDGRALVSFENGDILFDDYLNTDFHGKNRC